MEWVFLIDLIKRGFWEKEYNKVVKEGKNVVVGVISVRIFYFIDGEIRFRKVKWFI